MISMQRFVNYAFVFTHRCGNRMLCLTKSSEMHFSWFAPGRIPIRNIVKRIVALTPFTLLLLRKLYEIMHGNKILPSFLVLTPENK